MTKSLQVATTPWTWSGIASADALCREAEQAEAMGFHSLWLPENHFRGTRSIPSPLMLLAAIASRTKHLKLGCTSYLIPVRNPIQAAEEVAVLDQLCEGRLILGLGRGISADLFRTFGVERADKRKLFQQNLDVMLRAWRGESIVDDGGEPVYLSPLPVQQPAPPIWVAAFGPLALQQVAGLGLPYLASPIESLDQLEQNYAAYHARMAQEDLLRQEIVPIMRTVFVSKSRAATARLRAALDDGVPADMKARAQGVEQWSIVGDRAYVADKLQEYAQRLTLSHLILRGGLPGIEPQHERDSAAEILALAQAIKH